MKIDVILEPVISPAECAVLGLLAERCGIHAVWLPNIAHARDPFLCFSALATASHVIRMGPMAISPFELHPLKMATLLNTLNEMSQGRASIVVGGGGGTSIAMGLKPGRLTMHSRMVRGVRECVEFLKGVSAQGGDYTGDLFQVRGYRPTWVGNVPPRIYVGATFRQMLKAATRAADGVVLADVPFVRLPEVMAPLNEGLAAHGRSRSGFMVSNFLAWHVKPDRADARREARSKIWIRGLLMRWFLTPFLDEADCDLVHARFDDFARAYMNNSPVVEGVPDGIVDKLVDGLTLTGGIEDVDGIIAHLLDFRAAGLDEIALRLYGNPADSIRLIGERVVPAVA